MRSAISVRQGRSIRRLVMIGGHALRGHQCTQRPSVHSVAISALSGHQCTQRSSVHSVAISALRGHQCTQRSSVHSEVISALRGHPRPSTLELAGTPARRMHSRAKALKPTDP